MHADGAVNGYADTVLTGWRGHISCAVSGGISGYAQPSFRFDYSDVRLMGVTSLPLHNLGREDGLELRYTGSPVLVANSCGGILCGCCSFARTSGSQLQMNAD